MRLNGALGHKQLGGHLRITQAGCDQLGNALLAKRQGGRRIRSSQPDAVQLRMVRSTHNGAPSRTKICNASLRRAEARLL